MTEFQFPPALLSGLIYTALVVCGIGLTILLLLLWRDLRSDELW